MCVCSVAQLCPTLGTPWTVALQAPLSMEFPWDEYWSGLPFPPPGDLLDPGIESLSIAWQAASLHLRSLFCRETGNSQVIECFATINLKYYNPIKKFFQTCHCSSVQSLSRV